MDDMNLSYQSKYYIWDMGIDLWTYLRQAVQGWLDSGRFFPMSTIYVTLLMHYVSSAFVYKLCILIFILLNVYVFGAFVRRLTESRSFSLLAMAILPLCFQIRDYHDSLTAYHLLMQVLLLLSLFAAMALLQFLEKKKWIWLALSLIPYTLGLLTYEAAYASIFVLFFLTLLYQAETLKSIFGWANIKRTFFTMLPYALIMIALFGVSMYVKHVHGLNYEGIQAEFSAGKVLETAGKQLYAALPLSYHLSYNNRLGYHPLSYIRAASIPDFIAAAFLIVLSFQLLKKKWTVKNGKSLLGMGLSLLLVPAVLIGISAKYQKELVWGLGHIPVYLEYFGFVLCGILLISNLLNWVKKEKLRRFGALCFSFLFGFILLVQLGDNRATVELLNEKFLYSRELLDEGAKRGIFSELEDGSILIVENEPLYLGYPGKGYFCYTTGKKLEVYRMDEFLEQAYPENTPVYILSYETDKYRQELTLKEAVYRGEMSVNSISKLCLSKQAAKE